MPSAYCWPHSGTAGTAIPLCASSSLGAVHVTVTRVGANRDVVARLDRVPVDDHPVPDDAVAAGCGWPVAAEIATDASWPSGFYEVALEPVEGWPRGRVPTNGSNLAFFVLHPAPGAAGRVLMVLGTNTWLAYNDFGGSNLYTGSTHVSWDRPMANGLLAKPPGAGRRVSVVNPPDPRMAAHVGYIALEHLTQWAGSAGWPNYEEPFLAWAGRAGYEIDVATNADLERHPDLLDGVTLMLCVGHDEYWSSPQRDAVEAHVARGGNLVVLSGNTCFWQVRYEDDGRTMVGYKDRFARDPVYGTDQQHLLTSMWSDYEIGRPETTLLGVSFSRGGYSRIGRRVPAAGGYTVHRPEHWVFDGCEFRVGRPARRAVDRRRLRVRRLRVHGCRRPAGADARRRLPRRFRDPRHRARLALRPSDVGAPGARRRAVGGGVRGVATARRRFAGSVRACGTGTR